jgi:hypothetical protein
MSHSSQKWLIYALGGGLGHFHRALALSRAATLNGNKVKIISNSRFANLIPWKDEIGKDIEVVSIPHTEDKFGTAKLIQNQLYNNNYDRLVVDTFPRGLAGELPNILGNINVPKFLVSRYLNSDYIIKFNLYAEIEQYNMVFSVERIAPFIKCNNSILTEPWLMFSSNELYPREQARLCLGLESDDKRPLVVVCASGDQDDIHYFSLLAEKLKNKLVEWNVFFNSPVSRSGHMNAWPLLKYIRGIDALVGAGGYNLVHESRQTKTPLFAEPKKRLYDDQHERLVSNECYKSIEDLVFKLRSCSFTKKKSEFESGVVQSVTLIESF